MAINPVDELYRVFKPYRLGPGFSGCPCCVTVKDCQDLAAIPLRELTIPNVDRYVFKSLSTWGTVSEFKHFLPRLLELAWDGFLDFQWPEVLLSKLKHGDWPTWPVVERNAITGYLNAFWLHHLHTSDDPPTCERVRTVLGGLAQTDGESFTPYLKMWSEQTALTPALQLASFVDSEACQIMTDGTVMLWGNDPKPAAEMVAWVASDPALLLLERHRDAVTRVYPFTFSQMEGIRMSREQQ